MDFKCRACLSTTGVMKNFFQPSLQGLSLAEILEMYTKLTVNKSDNLPSQICHNCSATITDFFHFIKVFEESEKQLIALLAKTASCNNSNIVKQEKTTVKLEGMDDNREQNSVINIGHDNRLVHFADLTETCERMESTSYCCNKCGYSFSLEAEFQKHILQNHNLHVLNVKKCSSKIIIKSPSNGVKEEKDYLQRKECKVMFTGSSELNKYAEVHKNFICEHCGLTFKRRSNLNDHVVVHSTERRRICNICGKTYRSRGALAVHKKGHTNPKSMVCEKCGKGFNALSTLKIHIILKHTNERNFKCTVCETLFPLKSWLDKHMQRKHKDREKNHVCSICGTAYYEKFTLSRHILLKHSDNVKKHSCDTCGKHYTTKTNLMKHFRNFHGLLNNKEGNDNDK